VRPDGVTSFARIQNAAERQGDADLVYFVFDLLHLDGRNLLPLPLAEGKAGLAALLERSEDAIRYREHQVGQGPAFHRHACALGLEGIVSKRLDAPYSPGQRGLWVKTKCLNREEFVVVGWTDPEGRRPFRCRSMSPRRVRPGSARRWCCRGSIGCGPSSSSRLSIGSRIRVGRSPYPATMAGHAP
jgi:ATP-dependent DNA ligase